MGLLTCLSLLIPLQMSVKLHMPCQTLTTMTKSVSSFKPNLAIRNFLTLTVKLLELSQGSSAKAAVEEYASANNLKFNYVQLGSYPELAVSLYAYRIDAFAGDKSILSGYESDKTKILDEGFKTQEYGIASSKSNQELIDYTNDLLAKWQKDGSLQKLYDKYHLKPAKAEDK